MRRLLPALALSSALAGCSSSAPYTLPAAALNTGLALGVGAAQRASGGCYAVCTHGTVCNPKNGLCESASAETVCQEAPGGGTRCVPVQIQRKDEARGEQKAFPVGISPATGTVPPPPGEASPRGP